MTDLAARLKAKGYEQHKGTAFLTGSGVPSFSLGDENRVQSVSIPKGTYIAERPIDGRDKTMTDEQRQRIRVVLAEALDALKAIDPHLDCDSLERSSLARHCIRWVLRELDRLEDNDA